MRDHSGSPTLRRRVVGVRELKTHAARIVRQVRDARHSYVVTHRGQAVGVILPLDAAENVPSLSEGDDTKSWEEFLRAGRRLERRFKRNVSGVQLLTSSRR